MLKAKGVVWIHFFKDYLIYCIQDSQFILKKHKSNGKKYSMQIKKEYQYLDKRNIKTKAMIDKEGHYIMIKGSIQRRI